jgi:UDP-N-acetylglucosamine transferase subunit ALG13
MKAFVTVGSTSFPELLRIVFSEPFLQSLLRSGFYELIVQTGNDYLPIDLSRCPRQLRIIQFEYKDSLDGYFETSDLIISHAGLRESTFNLEC